MGIGQGTPALAASGVFCLSPRREGGGMAAKARQFATGLEDARAPEGLGKPLDGSDRLPVHC